MFDIKLSKTQTIFTLILFGILGLILRSLYFTHVTFGYDQARDAIEAIGIWKNDHIKIIGPMTDIRGLYHGTLYWYLLSPFYFFSHGNVLVVKAFIMLLNLSIIPLFYYMTKQMYKNTFIAILSSFIFTISFEAVEYGRWLSNPTPALFTILLTFYSLWLILNRDYRGIGLFFVFWAMSVHFEFFLVYHIFLLIIVLGILFFTKRLQFRKIFSRFNIVLFLVMIGLFTPFVVSEVKFGFQGIAAISKILADEKGAIRSFVEIRDTVMDKNVQSFFLNILSINTLSAGLLWLSTVLGSAFIAYKNPLYRKPILFSLFLFFAPLIVFSFEKLWAYFIMLGSLYGAIILFSVCVAYVLKKPFHYKWLFLSIIVLVVGAGNLSLNLKNAQKGEVIFSVQNKMLLNDERSLIDWVYVQSHGKPFYIDTVTNPLFINTTWAFLFDGYGRTTYGYMPGWLGYPQVGVYGEYVQYAQIDGIKEKDLYLIIEPGPGFPQEYADRYPWYEDTRSKLIDKAEFGGFKVEHRILTKDQVFERDVLMSYVLGTKPPPKK